MDNDLINEYFEWLYDMMRKKNVSHRKLFAYLHSTEFRFINPRDLNRAKDGVNLRYRFSLQHNLDSVPECLDGPCSVLEMIAALAIRCEETIMDNASIGDRTGQWFWGMIANMGLGSMQDDRFDKEYVEFVVNRFLNLEYEPNGKGGLFTIRNCDCDLRDVEIWYQLNWYLNTIT